MMGESKLEEYEDVKELLIVALRIFFLFEKLSIDYPFDVAILSLQFARVVDDISPIDVVLRIVNIDAILRWAKRRVLNSPIAPLSNANNKKG